MADLRKRLGAVTPLGKVMGWPRICASDLVMVGKEISGVFGLSNGANAALVASVASVCSMSQHGLYSLLAMQNSPLRDTFACSTAASLLPKSLPESVSRLPSLHLSLQPGSRAVIARPWQRTCRPPLLTLTLHLQLGTTFSRILACLATPREKQLDGGGHMGRRQAGWVTKQAI